MTQKAIFFLITLPVLSAQAQFDSEGGLALPPRTIASTDSSYGVVLNPATLGFLPSWDLNYVHSEVPSGAQFGPRGDAGFFATPLFWGFAAGFGFESVRPPSGALSRETGRLSIALSYALGRQFGLGTAFRYMGSQRLTADEATLWDLGASWRPTSHVALAVVSRATNGWLGLGNATRSSASVLTAVAFRPLGTDSLTIEAAGAADGVGHLGVRGALDVGVPYVGGASASFEMEDLGGAQDWRALAGLRVEWTHMGLEGGVITGDGLDNTPGGYAALRLSGFRQAGIPAPKYVLSIEINELSARSIVALLTRLEAVRRDPEVAGIIVRVRTGTINLASAQELRQMFEWLEHNGKPAMCHLEFATGGEFYACSGSQRVLIDPAGGVGLVGPSVDVILLGELLERIGVRADFIRIGDFKSAPEQLTQQRSSAAAVVQRESLLNDLYHRLLSDLARDQRVGIRDARRIVDNGPYTAQEAIRERLVSRAADERDLAEFAESMFGTSVVRSEEPQTRARYWGAGDRVGVVMIDGNIVDGDNVDIPFVGVHFTGGHTAVSAIDALAADPSIAAIVLRVDSPGGSALASDQIWRAVRRARIKKPVIASLGSVAASGGYYVASAADEIWADPATITGSIGIFYGKADLQPLAAKLGVGIEHSRRGAHAGVESIWRPFSSEERAMLADKIRAWYQLFLERVAEGRNMTVERVDTLGRGRVWSGDAARRLGLVDKLGGFGAALRRARESAHLPSDSEIQVVPFRPERLTDYLLPKSQTSSAFQTLAKVLGVSGLDSVAAAATFLHLHEGAPLAWMPVQIQVN